MVLFLVVSLADGYKRKGRIGRVIEDQMGNET